MKKTTFKPSSIEPWILLVEISRQGSLAKAAESLKIDLSIASRLIKSLEETLGLALLNRKRRPACLSRLGKELIPAAESAVTAWNGLWKNVEDLSQKANFRTIRISFPLNFLDVTPITLLSEYKRSSRLTFEYYSGMTDANILADEVDIAYVGSEPSNRKGVKKYPVSSSGSFFMASPQYLKLFGIPAKIRDLEHHRLMRCIDNKNINRPFVALSYQDKSKKSKKEFDLSGLNHILKADSLTVLNNALQGKTICLDLPLSVAEPYLAKGELVPVLPNWRAQSRESFLIVSERVASDSDILCFIEWLSQKLKDSNLQRQKYWYSKLSISAPTN